MQVMAVTRRWCSTYSHKWWEMQLKCLQHVDLSGRQTDPESTLTPSGYHSITDDYLGRGGI